MRRHVRIGSKIEELDVQFEGRTLVVTTSQGTRAVDLVPLPGGASLILDHRVYDIALSKRGHDIEMRKRDSHCFASVRKRATTHSEAPPANSRELRTRMPGRIVKVFVREGDEVQPHQALILLEAMKMQNEIRATAAAKVATLEVHEGEIVEANALLLQFEQS